MRTSWKVDFCLHLAQKSWVPLWILLAQVDSAGESLWWRSLCISAVPRPPFPDACLVSCYPTIPGHKGCVVRIKSERNSFWANPVPRSCKPLTNLVGPNAELHLFWKTKLWSNQTEHGHRVLGDRTLISVQWAGVINTRTTQYRLHVPFLVWLDWCHGCSLTVLFQLLAWSKAHHVGNNLYIRLVTKL